MNKTRTDWATSKQVCDHLQISRTTLYRWMNEGLPAHRGRQLRFDLEEVDEWLRSRCSQPAAPKAVA